MKDFPIVLVVADARNDCAELLRLLKREGDLDVTGPVAALEALRRCSEDPPAAAVVNVDLADISGTELCQLIRGRKATEDLPLLLFSSRVATYDPPPDRLRFADAFFPRSDVGKLVPKLRSLIKRVSEADDAGQLGVYDGSLLKANFERVHVVVDGQRIDLTRRELSLLQFLVTHRNHVLTRQDILQHVWKATDVHSRTIDTHIRYLRVKLGKAGAQIQTLQGVGYRFTDE